MKKLLILFSILLVSVCSCADKQKQLSKYVSKDSTLVFTFVNDSLYVDTYESGCGIEQYRLEEVSSNNNKTIYKAYLLSVLDENEKIELHNIIVSKNVLDAHWDYYIKFDNENKIPIMKISP
jgi:hypothetical protein